MRFAVVFSLMLGAGLAGSDRLPPDEPSRSGAAQAAVVEAGDPGAARPRPGPMPDHDRLAGPFPAETVAVIDGDTIEARVTIWIGQAVTTRVRLRDIDAPELSSGCTEERRLAEAARAALDRLLGEGPVTLLDVGRDKYGGRVLARVRSAAGRDVGAELLSAGLARPYQGGRRGGWCSGPRAKTHKWSRV